MNAASPIELVSEDEYFELDEHSQTKHEFWQGHIVAMAGAAPRHVQIANRVSNALTNRLSETPCEVGASDLKIKASLRSTPFPMWWSGAKMRSGMHVALMCC